MRETVRVWDYPKTQYDKHVQTICGCPKGVKNVTHLPLLNFTIGLPRSGKTTFAKRWLANFEETGRNRVVLSGDDFRLAIAGKRFDLSLEPLVRASLITAARALYLSGMCEILVDETNTSEAHIYELLNICPNATAYIFNEDVDTCIARAQLCGYDDLVEPIKRMSDNLAITLPKIYSQQIPIIAKVFV